MRILLHESPLERLSSPARDRLVPAAVPPEWVQPMLATLTKERFSDPAWMYERKLDGERCLAFRANGQVRLLSRNRKLINNHYPEIADALASQPGPDLVVDGEIVAFDGDETSFARLEHRIEVADPQQARATGIRVYHYLFDVVYLDGFDLTALALRDRKRLLRGAVAFEGPLRYTPHRNTTGEAYYQHACRAGWEGVIAKFADAPYAHRRSRDWLKFKCQAGQEFVIGGFTDPEHSREGFGALLIGYCRGDDLVYAGKQKEGGTLTQVVCENAATLVYLADLACMTPHAWLSKIDRPDHPDQLIFDLDPAGDDFESARAAALAVRSLLDELDLPSFVKTTGQRGIHVTVPLDRSAGFDAVRAHARDIARELVARHPSQLTLEQRKERRGGRLYLDLMRNGYAQTAVPPYAVRARPRATVATPLHWEELSDSSLGPARFTIRTVPDRIATTPDPWAGMAHESRNLAAADERIRTLGSGPTPPAR